MTALVGFFLGVPAGIVMALCFVALVSEANEWEERE